MVIYLVLDSALRFVSARSEDRLSLAQADAKGCAGLVVQVPVVSDYRDGIKEERVDGEDRG